jgi:hypothetical protein
MNSLAGGDWGGVPLNTSGYAFGSHLLFEANC